MQNHLRKFFVSIFVLASLSAIGQIFDPVKWNIRVEQLSGDEYNLIFEGNIQKGWFVYGSDIPDDGPVPTTITFDENADLQVIGPVSETGAIIKEGFDAIFEMNVKKFGEKAIFSQKVKIANPTTASGFLEFMVCDDERCLPPQPVDFEFQLGLNTDPGNDKGSIEPDGKQGILNPVKWRFNIVPQGEEVYSVSAIATIDEGWYVYSQFLEEGGPEPTEFAFELTDGQILKGEVEESGAKTVEGFDPIFEMQLKKYALEMTVTQLINIADLQKPLKGYVYFMTCDDTRCLPPEYVDFELDILTGKNLLEATITPPPVATLNPDLTADRGLLTIFLLGFVGGLLALLTPCVFPMIPLTVSFFTKQSKDKQKGFINATIYAVSIIVIYVSLGFMVTKIFGSDALNALSTNVIFNLAFFVVFVVFAISFFGYFEITLPASWVNKSDSISERGGLIGIFFMAFTLALVSFSCTGPIIGTLLVEAAVGGKDLGPLVGMAGFSIALAVPFALFAAFPGWLNTLPKSGGWLNSVKVVLGFLELALALKFLSNADLVSQWGLLKRETFLILWIIIFVLLGVYLIGKIRFPHDSPLKKIGWVRGSLAALSVAFAIYLIPGLWCKPLGLVSGFPPPDFYSYTCKGHCPHNLACLHDYDEALAYAKQVNKPLMVDFTGWACVNCRKMEENVWVDPRILKVLDQEYVLVSLYVDEKKELPANEQYVSSFSGRKVKTVGNKWSDFQASRYGNNSQPYYVLINHNEDLLNIPVGYMPNPDDYLNFLMEGVNNFKKGSLAGALE